MKDALELRKCTNVPWPNHRQRARRGACDTLLVKRVKLSSEGYAWIPRKHYGCADIQEAIESILSDEEILGCLLGPRVKSPNGVLSEMWDGDLWNEPPWADFYSSKTNLGLQLYLDWFQPFKRTQHSAGAMFLALVNLPLNLRYKWVLVPFCILFSSLRVLQLFPKRKDHKLRRKWTDVSFEERKCITGQGQ